MTEFWERSFKEKQEMWGSAPADATYTALELFQRHRLNKILIPGYGYGRNAKVFTDSGLKVTGIEISETAIKIAQKNYGGEINVHHGSVNSMPFDQESYDGIFCYALIHLLSEKERLKLIHNCYNQLRPNGYMVFLAISKMDPRFGEGEETIKDTFETQHGVTLFFYDADSVRTDFGKYGLIEVEEISETSHKTENKSSLRLLQIICRK